MKLKTVKDLTLDQKIGQLILAGFHSKSFDEHLDEVINEYNVGNVILFTRNFESAAQMRSLCQDIHKKIIEKTGIIPFIAIDQEGGLVTRMMKDVTFAPGPMTSSASIPHASYYTGKMLALDMIKLGINFNLAPSLDVNNNPDNPVIGVRSYSDDPYVVAKCGKEYIKGTTECGVLACAKHFPGHGDCAVDSHLGLPIIKHDMERIEACELVPFKENLDCPAIMSAHILFPTLDSLPATLSFSIITKLLRNKLMYNGLVMSDCLEMKAIANEFGTPRGALMAIKAGIDLVCISHTKEYQIEAVRLIKEALKSGEITMEELDAHVERILNAKLTTLDALEKHFYNNNDLTFSKESKQLASNIVDNSLTLIKGDVVDLKKKTLIIAPKAMARTIIEDEFDERNLAKVLNKELPNEVVYELNNTEQFKEEMLKQASNFEQVLIFSYNANVDKFQVDFINELLSKYHTYVVSLKGPLDYHKYQNLNNYMCLYEYTPNSIRTVVKMLNKEITPKGKCPIKL